MVCFKEVGVPFIIYVVFLLLTSSLKKELYGEVSMSEVSSIEHTHGVSGDMSCRRLRLRHLTVSRADYPRGSVGVK